MRSTIVWPAMLVLTLASCKKSGEIVVYTVDKEEEKVPQHAANPHAGGSPSIPLADSHGDAEANPHAGMKMIAAPAVDDVAPDHWQPGKVNAMRMASYRVEGEGDTAAEISFTTLRSVPGSLLNNINRWRGQVGQPPLAEENLAESTTRVATHFGDALVIDVAGSLEKTDPKTDGRIVGAIAEQGDRAWFYKLRGNAELVGREKEAFLKWLPTVKPAEPVAEVPPVVTAEALSWTLPDGWVATLGGESRYASIEVPGDEPTMLVVSFFPGDVGGDAANVNRWRGQIGLPPLPDDKVLATMGTIDAGPKVFSLVDLFGAQTRLLAAWVRHGEHTWFFKWTGPEAVLDDDVMKRFIGSVRFNSPES